MLRPKHLIIIIFLLTAAMSACRKDDVIYIPETIPVAQPEFSSLLGFYLLNEGNMGSNKATLDYYDFSTGEYTRNIYAMANPDVPMELGDVGNDLAIYGTRLYAVINCSNKVEVLDAATARRIGQVDIPNCRCIRFHEGFAYVTSYAGPVEIRPDYSQKGFVAKIDTATLEVVDRCIVGFQPDGLEIADGKIYVANSGGYMVPNYENTLSVVDLKSFTEIEKIPIAINLSRVTADRFGHLWVASRGNYYDIPSRLFCFDIRKHRIEKEFPEGASAMALCGDSLYCVNTSWSYLDMKNSISSTIINTSTLDVATDSFISESAGVTIKIPYCVAVNPVNRDVYVSDARNYVNPGYLYCFSREGTLKWQVRTGDVPARIAFYGK